MAKVAIKKIYYNGSSKVIKRLCEVLNTIIDNGLGDDNPLYYDVDGHICIDYDLLEERE